ncbi:MAG TPA: winged helix-turn-helix domain-containing protein [Pseudonocardiaceae bacterium]|nr:winged helix-turn-helix domain-containing protein [Pseudonocardiaceae bacterium]
MPRMPDYRKIVNDITDMIDSGELRSGDRLPSIRQLQAQYRVSAQPVKTALTVLHTLRRTEGRQGRGVFVV